MSQKILVFAGTKQSGKSTSAKFIHGFRMKQANSIRTFRLDENGELLVNAVFHTDKGTVEQEAVLDIYRQDREFGKYAVNKIWPFAKVYSFAEELKESAIRIFGLNPQYVYGSDTDKNQPTTIRWCDIWHVLSDNRKNDIIAKYRSEYSKQFVTHRELLQDFGTICRAFKNSCWIDACFSKIRDEGFPFCIIDDCRYENEVDVSLNEGADIVLLTKQPFKDSHMSERIHDVDRNKFSYILDNENMTLDEKNQELVKVLTMFGWNTGTI